MDFVGKAKRLDDVDIGRIAARIRCGEDELHAFMDVEASGSGFDEQNRPKMLFEPHVFYRLLRGPQRNLAVSYGLAYRAWGSRPYPADSYPRLTQAMAIDEELALMSASWGIGQILGVNHRLLGYSTAKEMVLAFMDDEEAQLSGIVDFLIANGIDDDLRAHRWDVVARVYNGPNYRHHKYHKRLAQRFAWWRTKLDTPI